MEIIREVNQNNKGKFIYTEGEKDSLAMLLEIFTRFQYEDVEIEEAA